MKKMIKGALFVLLSLFVLGCVTTGETVAEKEVQDDDKGDTVIVSDPEGADSSEPSKSVEDPSKGLQLEGLASLQEALSQALPSEYHLTDAPEEAHWVLREIDPSRAAAFWDSVRERVVNPSVEDFSLVPGEAFPVSWSVWGFFYNKALFSKLGLTEPLTWREFTSLMEDFRLRGYLPITTAASDDSHAAAWFTHLGLRLGGAAKYQSLMTGELPFSDNFTRLIMNYWRPMISKYFDPNGGSHFPKQAWDLVREEKAGVFLADSADLALVDEDGLDSLGFFPFPEMSGVSRNELLMRPRLAVVLDYRGPEEQPPEEVLADLRRVLGTVCTGLPTGQLSSFASLREMSRGEAAVLEDVQKAENALFFPSPVLSSAAATELSRICRRYINRDYQVLTELPQVDTFR